MEGPQIKCVVGALLKHVWISLVSCIVDGYPQGYTVTIRIWTNTQCLLRELSGPRPLRWAANIASKPRIWSPGTKAFLLGTQPTAQILGLERNAIPTPSTPPHADTISMPNPSALSVYTTRGFTDTDE